MYLDDDVENDCDNNPSDADIKKQFARSQIEFLKSKGLRNRVRLSRIFKACGPGQVREAWELANCEDWRGKIGEARQNLLMCILSYGDAFSIDANLIRDILRVAGFYVPKVSNPASFLRAVKGALEIMCPNSFKFSEEELQKIHSFEDEDKDFPLHIEEDGFEVQKEKQI